MTANVPAGETNYRLPVSFIADELARFSIPSDQDVSPSTTEGTALSEPLMVVLGGEPYEWRPGARRPRAFSDSVEALYLANTSSTPAQFRMAAILPPAGRRLGLATGAPTARRRREVCCEPGARPGRPVDACSNEPDGYGGRHVRSPEPAPGHVHRPR